ncbi:hypothetical protein [Kribbella amoyensis]|uniref:hypothetical protein n=1 Tax=Kribbella amoyensis TaxID=996641 RepID=UPI0011AB1C92|nr:hypothetical protein [Kribbella amoyensis]
MSNQQSGYPGGPQQGQPQYGQPQYGGYPPPPPRGPNKVAAILVGVFGTLLLIGTGVFVVSRFSGGSDDTAGDATRPAATQPANDATQPANDATTQPAGPPTTSGSPSSPPSSSPVAAECDGCFPGVTVDGLVRTLRAQGYTCKEDRVLGIECVKGKLEVGIDRDYTKKNAVENIDVGGRAGGAGDYLQGPGEAFATLKGGLPAVLSLAITDAAVRQQIIGFTGQHAGQEDGGPSTVKDARFGGYRVSIHGVSGAKVGKNGRYVSSYSTAVNIYGPSAY